MKLRSALPLFLILLAACHGDSHDTTKPDYTGIFFTQPGDQPQNIYIRHNDSPAYSLYDIGGDWPRSARIDFLSQATRYIVFRVYDPDANTTRFFSLDMESRQLIDLAELAAAQLDLSDAYVVHPEGLADDRLLLVGWSPAGRSGNANALATMNTDGSNPQLVYIDDSESPWIRFTNRSVVDVNQEWLALADSAQKSIELLPLTPGLEKRRLVPPLVADGKVGLRYAFSSTGNALIFNADSDGDGLFEEGWAASLSGEFSALPAINMEGDATNPYAMHYRWISGTNRIVFRSRSSADGPVEIFYTDATGAAAERVHETALAANQDMDALFVFAFDENFKGTAGLLPYTIYKTRSDGTRHRQEWVVDLFPPIPVRRKMSPEFAEIAQQGTRTVDNTRDDILYIRAAESGELALFRSMTNGEQFDQQLTEPESTPGYIGIYQSPRAGFAVYGTGSQEAKFSALYSLALDDAQPQSIPIASEPPQAGYFWHPYTVYAAGRYFVTAATTYGADNVSPHRLLFEYNLASGELSEIELPFKPGETLWSWMFL